MATLPDAESYDELYLGTEVTDGPVGPDAYAGWFERVHIAPFWAGGGVKGHVRALATRGLLDTAPVGARVLDAGSGTGRLSVYLAARGMDVSACDISAAGVRASVARAARTGVKLRAVAADLAALPFPDEHFNGIIGHASLHHFIKYPGVASELHRVLVPGGRAWFADGFGENPLFRVFHDRGRMERLGDVVLTRKLIHRIFSPWFEVDLVPADWFTMLDKLYLRIARGTGVGPRRTLSRLHHALDAMIPANRWTLAAAGSVVTRLRRREDVSR